MGDIVLRLPIREGEEDRAFDRYLNRFMEARSAEAERMAAWSDSPYLMIRSDPGQACKYVTFQQRDAASAFSSGWAKARGRPDRAA